MKRYHWATLLIVLFSAALSLGWFINKKPLVQVVRKPVAPQVNVSAVERQYNHPNHIVYAESDIDTPLSVIAKVSGDVEVLNVTPAKRVQAGSILLQLDTEDTARERQRIINDRQLQKKQSEALSKKRKQLVRILDSSQKQLDLKASQQDRQKELYQNDYVSRSAFDLSKSQLESLRIAKNRAQQQLTDLDQQIAQVHSSLNRLAIDLSEVNKRMQDAQITAPYSGVIGEVNVVASGFVSAGQVVATVMPDHQLRIKAIVSPEIYQLISNDVINTYLIDDGRRYELEFDRFEPYFDSTNGSMEAVFKTPSFELLYPLGQRFKLFMEMPRSIESYLVPLTSLYPGGYIYIVENSRLKRIDVKIEGYRFFYDQPTQIVVSSSNLPDSVDLLVDPIPDAIDSMQVRVKDAGL